MQYTGCKYTEPQIHLHADTSVTWMALYIFIMAIIMFFTKFSQFSSLKSTVTLHVPKCLGSPVLSAVVKWLYHMH